METTTLDLTKILKVGDMVYSAIHGTDITITYIDDTSCYQIITNKGKYTKHGSWYASENGECLLFPSKDNRDWSTYQRELVEGEFYSDGNNVFIHKKYVDIDKITSYLCGTFDGNELLMSSYNVTSWNEQHYNNYRVATKEQRQLILDLIDKEGYVYNTETVELDKKPHKFKPFDKVLVRDNSIDVWRAGHFSHYNSKGDHIFNVNTIYHMYCIPYEGNEHLVGTTDSPE